MKEKERDTLDELFRSKLQDVEADVQPEDWEAIARRLPGEAPFTLRRRLYYWAAAAAVSLLVMTGGLYLFRREQMADPVAGEIKAASDTLETRLAATLSRPDGASASSATSGEKGRTFSTENTLGEGRSSTTASASQATVAAVLRAPATPRSSRSGGDAAEAFAAAERNALAKPVLSGDGGDVNEEERERPTATDGRITAVSPAAGEAQPEWEETPQPAISLENNRIDRPATKAVSSHRGKKRQSSSRKWGIGMGAGSLSVGADNIVPQYVTNSSSLRSESLMLMNAVYFNELNLPKTEIHHKTPISFGFSVSRFLNDRFSLQTGLNYAFLSSEWETNGGYRAKTKQKLHFIGIPLSVSYKIAEWNRFTVYAAAGGMAEVNVAGKRQTQFIAGKKEMDRAREHVRMKEWLWSLNARAGVSYPLIRFVSAFAEVGAGYYFDNGSAIETIHSEKPFNVSLQLGFRLGF